ncbi:MAG: DUF6263 family protein [Ferruginibacter sp.]
MKKYLSILLVFISAISYGQKKSGNTTTASLILNKGQQITVTTSSSMDAEMGMGMKMKNDVMQTNTLLVTDVNDKNYIVSNTLNRIRLNGNMGAEDISFDSDKKEDLESEIGKSMKDKIGKTVIAKINRATGEVSVDTTNSKEEDAGENSFSGILGGNQGNDEENVRSAFFIIPPNKKPGDSWTDSTTAGKMKSVMEYKYISFDKDLANISIKTSTKGTNTMDANGMQFDIAMNSVSAGQLIVNTKTSLVQKRNAVADISGDIDMMGQSMTITSKANSISEYK